MTPDVTHGRVWRIAGPIVLANVATPLQMVVDVWAMGRFASQADLAAVGLGAEMVALTLVAFNFLQMATSGVSAQALGAGRADRVANTLWRAALVALIAAAALIALQTPLARLLLGLFDASEAVETRAESYYHILIWAAPAMLGSYALSGWFAGQAQTDALLKLHLTATTINIGATLILAVGLGWGLKGAAMATVLGQYSGLAMGVWLVRRRLRALDGQGLNGYRFDWRRVTRRAEVTALLALNRDVFLRTLTLSLCIAWMARQGAQLGEATLAGNVVLWQIFTLSAFMLDGFAMAAEALVGQAAGRGDGTEARRAAWITGVWSLLAGAVLAGGFWLGSTAYVLLMTDLPEARAVALAHVGWAVLTPLTGALAYHQDGVFVGLAAARRMRDAMILCALIYLPLSAWAAGVWGNDGVWAAAHVWLLSRAGFLLIQLGPAINQALGGRRSFVQERAKM